MADVQPPQAYHRLARRDLVAGNLPRSDRVLGIWESHRWQSRSTDDRRLALYWELRAMLRSCLLRCGATSNPTLICAPALPSVLTPDVTEFSHYYLASIAAEGLLLRTDALRQTRQRVGQWRYAEPVRGCGMSYRENGKTERLQSPHDALGVCQGFAEPPRKHLLRPLATGCGDAAPHWLRSPGVLLPVVKGLLGSLGQWHPTKRIWSLIRCRSTSVTCKCLRWIEIFIAILLVSVCQPPKTMRWVTDSLAPPHGGRPGPGPPQ